MPAVHRAFTWTTVSITMVHNTINELNWNYKESEDSWRKSFLFQSLITFNFLFKLLKAVWCIGNIPVPFTWAFFKKYTSVPSYVKFRNSHKQTERKKQKPTNNKNKVILHLIGWWESFIKCMWEQLSVWVMGEKTFMQSSFDSLCIMPSGF